MVSRQKSRAHNLIVKYSSQGLASGGDKNSVERLPRGDDDDDKDDDDDAFSNGDGAIQAPKLSTSTDVLKSIKYRFYQTVQDLPFPEIPDKLDSQIRFAQWLSRLPYQALTPMACSTPGRNSFGEFSPANNAFNLDMPVPASAEGKDLQQKHNSREGDRENCPESPMKHNHSEEWKEEIHGRFCVIDDNITPVRRPRAYALVKSRVSR